MANLPQSSQSDSMDSLTVTREEFRLAKRDELEYLAQALGNVSGSYTTETVDPNAVTLQGTPTLAAGAEPAAADTSLRLANTRWVKYNANSRGATAPLNPVNGQTWVDLSLDPPVLKIWDEANLVWEISSGGGGATGGGTDKIFNENGQTVTTDYTLGTTLGEAANAVSAGPVSIDSGVTVTIPSGSNWVIV